jgi:hypothetical protein
LAFLKAELVKNLGLVSLITPFLKSKDNVETIPRSLCYIFQEERLLVDLFEYWVSIEMVAAKSKGTLFRLNSCSTTFFTTFIKLNCLHYLWWVNAILIHEITLKTGRLDKKASRISNDDDEEMIVMESTTDVNLEQGGDIDELFIKANSYQLLLYLTQLERRIVTSDVVMPSDMRRMLRHIYKQGF